MNNESYTLDQRPLARNIACPNKECNGFTEGNSNRNDSIVFYSVRLYTPLYSSVFYHCLVLLYSIL